MKIGVLTFHRVYNYGAVLQAYCTQKILDGLQVENEIIDFSIPRQKDFTSLYSTKNGVKRFVKTLMLLPLHKQRMARVKKFDKFISSLKKTSKTYYKESDLIETNQYFDGFMVGSDQIWNVRKKAESSDAYFLSFVDDKKYRFSYASSIGVSDSEDLTSKKDYLNKFAAISCRESGGTNILKQVTGKDVTNVLDPTLLVDKKELEKISVKSNSTRRYLFYYSLDGHDKKDRNINLLRALCEKYNLQLKLLTPEWPFHEYGEDLVDVGPEEFLGLIDNADLVCTNSFHGTALSIKLNVPFFVLEDKNIVDERKRSILVQLGLEDRIISNIEDIKALDDYSVDYEAVNNKLERLRNKSYDYLHSAINGGISCE